MLASLVLGSVLDASGPRVCSVLAHISIVAGFAVFSAGRHAAGAVLMAFGGPGIQASVVHISNRFGRRRYLVLSGLTGSMSISFSVFGAFDWIWERYRYQGMSVKRLFGSYAFVAAASLIASWIAWPDEAFPVPVEGPSYGLANEERRANASGRIKDAGDPPEGDDDLPVGPRPALQNQTFREQISSRAYHQSALFLLVTSYLANLYVASYSTEARTAGV
jgi:hypothetical protein